jgi:hypothetical protein
LYVKDDKYYITINVRDCDSLLYEIEFDNLFNFLTINKAIWYYDNYIKEIITNISNNFIV